MTELSQVNAPIYEALRKFRRMRVVPFDVPGHKRGRGNMELTEFLGEDCMNVDVNSMKPLDNLCHPVSVIKDAEMLAAQAFGAANAFFMVLPFSCFVLTSKLSHKSLRKTQGRISEDIRPFPLPVNKRLAELLRRRLAVFRKN